MCHNVRGYPLIVISVLGMVIAPLAYAADPPPLSAAVVRGSSVYTALELFGAYREELGQPADRERAQKVMSAVASMYTRDGYARPEIRIDDASLAQGIVQIDVHEPQLARVTIEGDAGPYGARLEQLRGELEGMRPIRNSEVQRALARMRAFPGLSVSAGTQRDGEQRAAYVLAIEATYDPVDGLVRASNRGTEEIGPNFVVGQAVANGLIAGEKIGVFYTAATQLEEYRGAGAFLDVPVNSLGTRALLLAFGSKSEPAAEPGSPIDRYSRQRASLRFTHPLPPASRVELSLSASVEAEDFEIRRDGAELRDERLRVLQIGSRASWRSAGRMQYQTMLDVRTGFDDFGAGLQAADLAEDARREDFVLTRLTFVQLTRFNDRWSLRFDALGQWSGYVLPYSERFKVGGERLGRGFEVTEIAGDRGVGGKIELRRSFARATALFGRSSLYGFYDIGAAWTQDLGGRDSLATAGLGLAATAGRVTGYIEVAKPLTRADLEGKRSATVFVEISVPF